MEGLATAPAAPARIDLAGRIGVSTTIALRGSVGAIGGPLQLDLDGELRRFGLAPVNSYVRRHVGWQVRDGWLTADVRCRIDGDALSVRTNVRLSHLRVNRAEATDEAQRRIGLPLGLLVALLKDGRGDIALSFPVSGHLHDPRFDFREAMWGAVRRVAVNAVSLPISWIGRVQIGAGTRIEGIEIDPIPFQPGTALLAAEGQDQAARLAAFLDHTPAMRVALTPVISSRDEVAARRQRVEALVDRLAREDQLPREAALARLFDQRFRDRAIPSTVDAVLDALAEDEDRPDHELRELATQRVDAVRVAVARAGIDPARLQAAPAAARSGPDAQVDLSLLDPAESRPSPVREFLERMRMPVGRGGDDGRGEDAPR